MKCPQCGKQNLLVEGLGEGKKKLTCQACGYSKIEDSDGRKMLTDNMPPPDRRQVITG